MYEVINETPHDFKIASLYAHKLYPKGGIIILCKDYEGRPAYWHVDEREEYFGNEYEAEHPKLFKTVTGALRKILLIQKKHNYKDDLNIGFWIHPDYDSIPLSKYLSISGNQFPGSPRQ